ncbi:MAG: prepilin peptidase [Brotaphodocola sp.]
MEQWMFGVFLAIAAGQDLKKKQVDIWVFILFGGLALTAAAGRELWGNVGYRWMEHIGGICLGFLLFGIGSISRGGVGIGDGCFFLVSGMMLNFRESMMLLSCGTLCCGLYSLIYLVWMRFRYADIRVVQKQVVPFLPFLIPPGIWLVMNGAVR